MPFVSGHPKRVMECLLVLVTVLVLTRISDADNYKEAGDRRVTFLRQKRETTCQQKYQSITTGHSACLQPSSKVLETEINDADIKVILDMHNTARRDVSPQARNMRLMTWDTEIANTAQHWAENCITSHDGNYKRYAFGRFSVGQNLAWGQYKMGWSKAVQLWMDERKDFSYGTRSTTKVVGHYTQMVWAETSKVGCGYAFCNKTYYYVCNYAPAGNSAVSVVPYISGTTCADCPSKCTNGLCDCGEFVCLNGGDLDLNKCSCSCKYNLAFFLQPDCALNCTDIRDYSSCSQFMESDCEIYSNIPQQCPKMCKWCPTAGKGYEQDTTIKDEAVGRSTNNIFCMIVVICTLCALYT